MTSAINKTILLVDDDELLQQLGEALLMSNGYNVILAGDGASALKLYDTYNPDLVILDLGLPEISGWDVLSALRDRSDVPVLILTARGDLTPRVHALRSGADDYVVKPFANTELIARVQALLRRAQSMGQSPVFEDGPLTIDKAAKKVMLQGEEKILTPTEWKLLVTLTRNPGHTVSSEELLEKAWNDPSGIGKDRVKFAVLRLRNKIELDDLHDPIENFRGMGYKWVGYGNQQ